MIRTCPKQGLSAQLHPDREWCWFTIASGNYTIPCEKCQDQSWFSGCQGS
ncbi:hypothetical protein ACN4EK_29765 [Pantanalinema rosaneae CENA516]